MKTQREVIILPSDLKTRSEARELSERVSAITANTNVVFDFSRVTYMGRSFADEFYNDFMTCNNFKFIDLSDEIENIFKTVSKSQHGIRKRESPGTVEQFDDMSKLSSFLTSL